MLYFLPSRDQKPENACFLKTPFWLALTEFAHSVAFQSWIKETWARKHSSVYDTAYDPLSTSFCRKPVSGIQERAGSIQVADKRGYLRNSQQNVFVSPSIESLQVQFI